MTVREAERESAAAAPKAERRRRRLIILACVLVPLVIVYGGVCRFLTHKLQATVAAKLDAELKIDSLLYFPPYGVRLSGAHLVRKNNVILNLGRLNLKLAESPFRKGPIVIEHFDVDHPIVRIIRTRQGLQGGPGFVKEQVKTEPEPRKKFSDFLRLRKFKITNGQITYDDDTNPYTRDVTWRDINVEIHTAQKGPALYTYELSFGNAPIVDASAAGSVDVDALVVALDHLHVSAAVDPAQAESPLPSAVQKIVEDYQVAGRLTFDGKAMIPFRQLQQMTYDGAVELAGAKLRVPKWDAALDDASIKLRLSAAQVSDTAATRPSVPALSVAIDSVHLAAGGATLAMSGGTVIADPASGTWSLRQLTGKLEAAPNAAAQAGAIRDAIEKLKVAGAIDFTGAATGPFKSDGRTLADSIRYEALLYPRGLSFQPTKFPAPLHDIGGGVIRIANGEAVAEDLRAMYGQDCWMLNTARVPLSDLRDEIRIEEADGSMEFHPPSPEYPKALRATVKALAPEGEFPVTGWIHVNPKGEVGKRATYDLVVSSDGVGNTFNVTPHRIPITNIRGDARVLRETIEIGTVDIKHFDGDSLGGTVSAKTTFITTKPRSWAGTASVRDVRLEHLANYFNESDKQKQKLVGRAFANVDLSGETEKATALDSLRGSGRVEVFDGEFFELPVLGPITKVVSGDQRRDLGTVGEAAVLFDVHGRTIHLRDAAVSAPLLGVQGDGQITLDGNLDLNVCAAPLADWRDKLKQTNIPIVSDVTGEIVGAIQRLLNSATRGLLYEFRVTGNVKEPKIELVPAPALNEARAVLFGRMLGGKSKDKPLIDSLNRGEEAKSK